MIALLDNSQDLNQCALELGCEVGQLLTPLTRYTLRHPEKPWAIDNGAFSEFNTKAFLTLLNRENHHREKCLFVAAPDVVGSARRTLEVFPYWREQLDGWKVALVCQDGAEDLTIPWSNLDAVFIGGSTNWKCSHCAEQIVRAAIIMGKWVHVGRVNHGIRFEHFKALGADSYDGTGISRFSHMRRSVRDRDNQGRMELQT